MKQIFDRNLIRVAHPYQDPEVGSDIFKISYSGNHRNIIIETPELLVTNLFFTMKGKVKGLEILLQREGVPPQNAPQREGEGFFHTLNAIDSRVIGTVFSNYPDKMFGRTVRRTLTTAIGTGTGPPASSSSNSSYVRFSIPLYKNRAELLIRNANGKICTISDIKSGMRCKCVVYLSHAEIDKKRFFLRWNLMQMNLIENKLNISRG
jgi:hypothetical protein